MKGNELQLVAYLDGAMKRFVIPVYQRNYDWKIENCKQFFNDLVTVIKENRSNHFFGSIVSVYNNNNTGSEYLIIDGQQRITTINLMFLAIHNLIKEGIIKDADEFLSQRIWETFLVNKYNNNELKLNLIKKDQKAYTCLFKEKDKYINDSNITINYNFFYEQIQKANISVNQLFQAICKLIIINIELNQEDNAQLIFESLNSTGLGLTEADKIRNFILMHLDFNTQNKYYDNYWNPIEINTQYDVSSFIRDYLSTKLTSIPSQNNVYKEFKEYFFNNKIKTEDVLKDLLNYSKSYNILVKGFKDDKCIDGCIQRLNRLENTVIRPFFLEVFDLYSKNKLKIEEIKKIFEITESFIFRRQICGLPTNILNKIFFRLHREIINYDHSDSNYFEKFKYKLLMKTDSSRFPNDEEFASKFIEYEIGKKPNKKIIYILERFENFSTKEDKDIYSHWDNNIYSIEHIMPQTLSDQWKEDLGENYEEIHNTWLQRIANLTLTGYNSKYSNRIFNDKKNMENGFRDSGLRLNFEIAENNKWTKNEIETRANNLKNKALKIWYLPTSNFYPKQKENISFSLDEEINATNLKLLYITYKGTKYDVNNWTEMYTTVISLIFNEDKSIITKMSYSDDNQNIQLSINPKELRAPFEIGDGIYVETNSDTNRKISNLIKLFKDYDLNLEDLIFFLDDKK